MAQTREIAERRRQEEVEDNDIQSDSELSEMASSLFNGMEGIETGGVSQVTLKWAEQAVALQVRMVRMVRAVVWKMSVAVPVAGSMVGLQSRALEPILGALD
jgi:hypothetical protein